MVLDSRTLANANAPGTESTAGNATKRPETGPDARESLAGLADMKSAGLRAEWSRLYRSRAPMRMSIDLLVLAVAWKRQEQAHGGSSAATKRRLAVLMKTLEEDGDLVRSRIVSPKPGARLLREWRGETHVVIVMEDGFEWRGERHRSLSAIARAITGTRWSGPRFFGLKGKAVVAASEEATNG